MGKKKTIFCLVMLLITGSNLLSQTSLPVSATGHITAEIIPIFSATETAQMNFGRFSPGLEGGEILLTPESTITVLGSIYTSSGTYNAASFYVSGDSNASFSISFPDDPVVLQHVSSEKKMIIEDLLSNPGAGNGAGVLSNGFKIVYVGAKLKVGTLNDNPVGVYAGTYTITFDFN
jgi:hypothetical protein